MGNKWYNWEINVVMIVVSLYHLSCALKHDVRESPAELNQYRTIFKTGNSFEIGILGFANNSSKVSIFTYGKGYISIRGLDDCGFRSEVSTDKVGYFDLNLADLPDFELCRYEVTVAPQEFDSAAMGTIIVRKFNNPNIVPLNTKINGITRSGVNWMQLREDGNANIKDLPGIPEGRSIYVLPSGTRGTLNIDSRDCQVSDVEPYDFTGNTNSYALSLNVLYHNAGGVHQDCTFLITANNDDYLTESAVVFVNAYKSLGGFIATPTVKKNAINQMCFEFTDEYVVASSVNGKYSYTSPGKVCVSQASTYTVFAVTSKLRLFYGEYDGIKWRLK